MALFKADTLRSNNPDAYGIVLASEISGHKSVNTLNDLFSISDAILSVSKNNTNNDAIGQLWYVVDVDKYYKLIDWDNRKTEDGWRDNTKEIDEAASAVQDKLDELKKIVYAYGLDSEAVAQANNIDHLKQILNGTTDDITVPLNKLEALGANYSNLVALATTFKNFLESKDVADASINKWKEIEDFLTGITDTQTLTGLLTDLKSEIQTEMKVKDVDGTTIVKDESGIISVQIDTTFNTLGDVTNPSTLGTATLLELYTSSKGLRLKSETKEYNGEREINENACNLVQERALYKHLKEIENNAITEQTIVELCKSLEHTFTFTNKITYRGEAYCEVHSYGQVQHFIYINPIELGLPKDVRIDDNYIYHNGNKIPHNLTITRSKNWTDLGDPDPGSENIYNYVPDYIHDLNISTWDVDVTIEGSITLDDIKETVTEYTFDNLQIDCRYDQTVDIVTGGPFFNLTSFYFDPAQLNIQKDINYYIFCEFDRILIGTSCLSFYGIDNAADYFTLEGTTTEFDPISDGRKCLPNKSKSGDTACTFTLNGTLTIKEYEFFE